MLVVGALFILLGVYRYPAFIVVGLLYLFIGLRGLRLPIRSRPGLGQSDKAQLESL
jgi:hypothetical protein